MFGRLVKIGDRELFVPCTPYTPYSEILLRAAQMLKNEEYVESQRERVVKYTLWDDNA